MDQMITVNLMLAAWLAIGFGVCVLILSAYSLGKSEGMKYKKHIMKI